MNYIQSQLPETNFQQQLQRLNQSLKRELDQCYIYIQRLQNDLKNIDNRHSQNISNLDNNSQAGINQQTELRLSVQKLTGKLGHKRSQFKKLQKAYIEMEQVLIGTQREKEELQGIVHNMENGFNHTMQEMNGRLMYLEGIIGEQRQNIEYCNRQLESKGFNSQQLIRKIEELERDKIPRMQETETLRKQINYLNSEIHKRNREIERQKQSNSTFQSTIQQLTIQYNQTTERSNRQIRDLENQYMKVLSDLKLAQAERQISKKTHIDFDNSLSSRISIFSSSHSPRYFSVNRRNTTQDDQYKQKQESQKQDLINNINILQNQIKSLQDELKNQHSQTLKLKQDFVNMRVQYSTMISKNTQLIQTNMKLQQQKNQLNNKLQDKSSVQFGSPTNNKNNRSRILNQTNTSILKTVTSNHSTVSQYPMTRLILPSDGEIPVRDKNSTRSSHVCISSSGSFGNPQHIQLRKSSAVIKTFPLYSSYK